MLFGDKVYISSLVGNEKANFKFFFLQNREYNTLNCAKLIYYIQKREMKWSISLYKNTNMRRRITQVNLVSSLFITVVSERFENLHVSKQTIKYKDFRKKTNSISQGYFIKHLP